MSAAASFDAWALPQLTRLLGLDEESVAQIVAYTLTLPRDAASEHLTNLLGDSGPALEFIASFNQRRPGPAAAPSSGPPTVTAPANAPTAHDGVPARPKKNPRAAAGRPKKGLSALPPPRQVDDAGAHPPGYVKKAAEDDYMAGAPPRASKPAGGKKALASALALQPRDAAPQQQPPSSATSSARSTPPPPPSQSRTASPAPRQQPAASAKISLSGGTAMRGPSSALADLDSAIRQLEAQTNPTLARGDDRARACACQAQRHPLLAAAPNCLACGKIVCAKEGLGPCTSCGAALLSRPALAGMLRALKDERGRTRQAVHNAHQGGPSSSPAATDDDTGEEDGEAAALRRARAHRDRLLAFQAQNARRTTVRDEAADFETPDAGLSAWASPAERAAQLKRQQRVLREQAWAAKPEFEKRRMVVSLDVKGGRAVRRFEDVGVAEGVAAMEDGDRDDDDDGGGDGDDGHDATAPRGAGFARNPLLGGLTRPIWTPAAGGDDGKGKGRGDGGERERESRWRRVQDDDDGDNERWILDGGAYGGRPEDHAGVGALGGLDDGDADGG